MEDLDVLIPKPVPLTVRGASIEVTPIHLGELPDFVRATRRLMPHLDAEEIDYVALVSDGGDDLIAALSIALRIPADEVRQFNLAETMRAVRTVIEVNLDFFSQAVLLEIEMMMAAVDELRGQIPPSTSSPTGTAGPTS